MKNKFKHWKADIDYGDQSDQIKDIFLWNTKRGFINICKRYLVALEELRVDHSTFLKKLGKEIDPELVKKLDYLSEEKYNYIRKQVLDAGNDAFRDAGKIVERGSHIDLMGQNGIYASLVETLEDDTESENVTA